MEPPAPKTLDYATPLTARSGREAPAYVGRSIFTMLVFFPFGMVALAYSLRCRHAKENGDMDLAEYFSYCAALWGMAALIAPLAALVVLGAFGLVVR